MRVIVCGGRDYFNREEVFQCLDGLNAVDKHLVIIEGGATGADVLAFEWVLLNLPAGRHEQYPADWDKYGKGAGPIRNQKMLDLGADLVIAFPGGRGTADMVRRALKAGVEVTDLR